MRDYRDRTRKDEGEIVTCRFNDGSELRLFYKYGVCHSHNDYGHRGGIAYEAEVHRHMPQPLQVSVPTFYGAYTDRTIGKALLILEYLHNSVRVNLTPEPAATISLAARWIERFHAANEARLLSAPMSFLNTDDVAYYLAWARQVTLFASQWHRHFPWLATLCKRFEEFVSSRLAPPPTVIHGEYTPHNVLIRGRIIYPIDCESAAIAVGEVDLAILGVADANCIFIAVGTPTMNGGAGADMQYVESAARSIAEHLRSSAIIVNKSTMPVGSGDLVSAIIGEHLRATSLSVAVVANPEFLREGSAVQDFLQPARVVLGSSDRAAAQRVAELYLPLCAPIVITDLYTAEMIKYASNTFLATKISFMNEIARICDRLGADVKEVAAGMGYDKRIGRAFLDAGLAYGGSGFGKDGRALAHMASEAGLHPELLEAVMKINQDQRHFVLDKLEMELGAPGSLRDKIIAVLGLAFKDNTDDMRDAPALDLVNWLIKAGAHVREAGLS